MSENRPRRDGMPGTYEVWYTTWNHPTTNVGFWLRFIIEAPPTGPARGELWFAAFDPRDATKTFGIHEHVALGAVTTQHAPFAITIGDSHLADDHTHGTLAGDGHAVQWNLRWEPSTVPLRMLPDVMYARGGIGDTVVLSPNPRVLVSGTVTVDGVPFAFDHAPAGQSHIWARKHAYAWTWAHCGDWDDGSNALVELLGSRLQKAGVLTPPLTLVSLDLDGERVRMNQYRHLLANRSTWGVGRVDFSAWSPTVKLTGELTCTPDEMLAAPYFDPDGTPLFCMNTEIASARITIFRRSGLRWLLDRTLVTRHRAHFEVGQRTADPTVTRRHVRVR